MFLEIWHHHPLHLLIDIGIMRMRLTFHNFPQGQIFDFLTALSSLREWFPFQIQQRRKFLEGQSQ